MVGRALSTPLVFASILLLLSLGSCDRRQVHAPTTMIAAEPSFQVELKPLTPLLPHRPTHPAVDPQGNVYWVQETDRSDDTLFVIGEGDVPRATQLSAATISAEMGMSGGRGHILDIAAGPAGEIYFYFYGQLERQSLAAFGRYIPGNNKIQILADTSVLEDASSMGLSLPLARATVVTDGRFIWLWVRHTDAWAILRFDPSKLPALGMVTPVKAFKTVTLDSRPIDLTSEDYNISAGPDQTLFLVDPSEGRLLKISPDGAATVVQSLVGLPGALSTPAVDAKGQILLFAANVDPIKPARLEDVNRTPPPAVAYPAMLVFGDKGLIDIARDDIIAYPGFPVFGMRLNELIPNPTRGGWVSYDAGSGELLRLKIREKIWPSGAAQ